jgi:hypothetical protein
MLSEKLRRDADGKLWLGDFPLPLQIADDGALEFFDKDRRRSARRGSPIVRVDAALLIAILAPEKNE